jgi:hypothetical protein
VEEEDPEDQLKFDKESDVKHEGTLQIENGVNETGVTSKKILLTFIHILKDGDNIIQMALFNVRSSIWLRTSSHLTTGNMRFPPLLLKTLMMTMKSVLPLTVESVCLPNQK